MQDWEHVRADIDRPVTVFEAPGPHKVSLWLGALTPEDRIEIKSEARLFLPDGHSDGSWELVEHFVIDFTKPRSDQSHLLTVNGNQLGQLKLVTVKTDDGPWVSRITIAHKRGTPKAIPFIVY
jgi:hypothetical protein